MELRCFISRKLMKTPVQLVPCRHVMDDANVKEWFLLRTDFGEKPNCPRCSRVVQKVVPHDATAYAIAEFLDSGKSLPPYVDIEDCGSFSPKGGISCYNCGTKIVFMKDLERVRCTFCSKEQPTKERVDKCTRCKVDRPVHELNFASVCLTCRGM